MTSVRARLLLTVATILAVGATWGVYSASRAPDGRVAPPRTDAGPGADSTAPSPTEAPESLAVPTRPVPPGAQSVPGSASARASAVLESGTLVVEVRSRSNKVAGVPSGPVADADVVVQAGDRTWRAQTDAKGEARFAQIPLGRVYARVWAEGFVGSDEQSVAVEKGVPAATTISLALGVPFDGHVVDHDGRPVALAAVSIHAGVDPDAEFSNSRTYDETTSDGDGAFHVRGVPERAPIVVVARAPGLASDSAKLRVTDGKIEPVPVLVRLEPEGRLVGTVVDPGGRPVRAATVYVFGATDSLVRSDPTIDWSNADDFTPTDEMPGKALKGVTGADGSFAIAGLRPGVEYVAVAYAPGFMHSLEVEGLSTTATVRDARATIPLRPPSVVDVRVVDLSGRPVTSLVGLRLDDLFTSAGSKNAPDEANLFRLEDVLPGRHRVSVTSNEFLPVEVAFDVVQGAATTDVRVALDPGVGASGVVVDEAGRPVAKARVLVGPEKDNVVGMSDIWLVGGRMTETDDEGRFEFRGLERGASLLAAGIVGAGSHTDVRTLSRVRVDVPASGIRLELVRLGTLSFRLVKPDGVPFAGDAWLTQGIGTVRLDSSNDQVVDGLVKLTMDGFGPSRVAFAARGFAAVERTVDVKPRENVDLGDVRLDVGFTYASRVIDGRGLPIARADVSVDDRGAESATSNAEGRFKIEHLLRRRSWVRVSADGFVDAPAYVDFGSGKEPAEWVLRRGALVRGAVVGSAEKPADGTRTVVFVPIDASGAAVHGEARCETEVKYDGSYSIRIPEGAWRVESRVQNGRAVVVIDRVEVVDGTTRELKLVVPDR